MDAATTKLKTGAPFSFRPGPSLGPKLAELVEEIVARGGSITPTELMRHGLLDNWDTIRTNILLRHTVPAQSSPEVGRILDVARTAMAHGLTVDQVEQHFAQLLETRLTSTPTQV